jgi:hypothetical protein
MTDCTHAMVQQVTIEAVDDQTVTFTTRSASNPGNLDDSLRRTFTVPVSEVWTTPIEGAPPPVELRPGAVGNLFLSRAGWEAVSADGRQIFGAGTDAAVFKWPWCAAPPRILCDLSVVPASVVVRGHLEGRAEFFEIELLGDDAAGTQHIRWNSTDYIELRVTARGAQRLGLGDAATTAKLWPTRITIAGSPACDRTISGEVDVLDAELAGWSQDIVLAPGAPITLSLTLDGVSAFHVAPQAAARSAAGAA